MTNKEFATFYKEYIESLKKYNIDICYKCPLKCPFCVRQSPGGKEKIKESDDITLDEFQTILKSANHIAFCGQISDPIYHPKFLEIMEIISKNPNKSFSIHTNGTRKSKTWWKQVFLFSGSNVTWIFGLDGADQETANKYRVNTKFNQVMDVMKLGASMEINVEWQFIVFKHNEHQIELAKTIAKDNNINLQLLKSSRWYKKDLMEKYNIYPPSDNWISSDSQEDRIFFINKK
jgi:MoaA/NifB/PqqE/SkfB family radical SAM enzyme